MSRRRRGRALRRRYGHRRYGHSLKDVENTTADLRKLVKDNSFIVAAAAGAGLGAVVAGMGAGQAALIGAGVGAVVDQIKK